MRVLLVDDSRAMRSYVRGVLSVRGDVKLIDVGSGFEALRLLPREQFDLVITDINMPDINGIELLRFVRRSERHASVPVIIITTQASEREKQRARDLGASGFLPKPFEPEQLLAEIERTFGPKVPSPEDTP